MNRNLQTANETDDKSEFRKRMIDLIAFDADDTLWHNETIFHATEQKFVQLLAEHREEGDIRRRLFDTEMRNLTHYGYGVKGFILSMVETAIELSERRVTGEEIQKILEWGQEMLRAPIEVLGGVRETIEALAPDYRLMLLTKGDLFDQESKLARSGLGEFFDAIEIVSDKNSATYRRIMQRHAVAPERFVMVGNSLRSDILPVVEAGGRAVHVPYELTWAHEVVSEEQMEGKEFARLATIADLPLWLARLGA